VLDTADDQVARDILFHPVLQSGRLAIRRVSQIRIMTKIPEFIPHVVEIGCEGGLIFLPVQRRPSLTRELLR